MFILHDDLVHLVSEERHSDYGGNDEPGGVEDQPREVESHLLAVVVRYEVQRLHVLYIVACNESKEQFSSKFSPTLTNFVLKFIM